MDLLKKEKNNLSIKELEKIILFLSDKYYNDQPLVSDEVFDEYIDILKEKSPHNKVFKQIGAPIRDEMVKVKLPVWMGSLDKVKNKSRELEIWLEKYPQNYVISDKLDGISALYKTEDGKIQLFTRGDGNIGQDISYLVDFMDLPQIDKNIMIRGELIITKKIFSDKYSKDFPKGRSVVAGIVNSKKPDLDILRDIDFIAYELISDKNNFSPEEQLKIMKKLKFNVSWNKIEKYLNDEKLLEYLEKRKKEGPYEVDGIVITSNEKYDRNTSGNPKYSVAYKKNDKGKITTVIEVDWNASKYGVLIPRLKVEPIILDGDTVQYCTAFNAKFIYENNIGPETKIRMVKSGDVIPYVTEIISSTKAQMPKGIKYHWNETEVDIILDKENETVLIKRITNFFKTIEVEGLSEATIKRLVQNKLDSIDKIIFASIEDFNEMEGFQIKSSTKLFEAIHEKVDNYITLEKLMTASMIFGHGFGVRRFKLLLENIPSIYERKDITLEDVLDIEGFSEITAQQFLDNYNNFWSWLENHNYLKYNIPKKENKKSGQYTGKNIVLTGFRDKDLEKEIISQGGKVQNTVNKNTDLVIAKDINENSSKLKKARDLEITIIKR